MSRKRVLLLVPVVLLMVGLGHASGRALFRRARPTPEVIEKVVPVEKIVKQTVIVEKEVLVEKVVKETVVVQKEVAVEKVITATPVPAAWTVPPPAPTGAASGALPQPQRRHPQFVRSVAFSPDGLMVATGSDDSAARLWRVSDGALVRTLQEGITAQVLSVAFSPDGSMLATLCWNYAVRLWRVSDGEMVWRSSSWVPCLAFSPDGKLLATGSTDGVWLWGEPGE